MAQKQLHLTVHLQVDNPDVDVVVHVVKVTTAQVPLVVKVAAEYCKVDPVELLTTSRKRMLVMGRKICAVILRDHEGKSLQQIASTLNYTNHTTVVYHMRTHEDNLIYDDMYHKAFYQILNNYKSLFRNETSAQENTAG
jgi:chromosomal replication initiation ATPase DnaA